jgi:hypothetical protein
VAITESTSRNYVSGISNFFSWVLWFFLCSFNFFFFFFKLIYLIILYLFMSKFSNWWRFFEPPKVFDIAKAKSFSPPPSRGMWISTYVNKCSIFSYDVACGCSKCGFSYFSSTCLFVASHPLEFFYAHWVERW